MASDKKTVVVGASPNPSRYAYRAAHMLTEYGHKMIPLSIKKGSVAGEEIMDLRKEPEIGEVDTLSLYIGPQHHEQWKDYLLGLSPNRIIFNPGTENQAFIREAEAKGIEVVEGCTLVMLQVGTF